ncbi:sulfite reductase [Colletotrichum asianum]
MDLSIASIDGRERDACRSIDPAGFFIRHPPAPHVLDTFITHEDHLFQTIHMGAAVVDKDEWLLIIDGLVERPFALTFNQLRQLPRRSVTAFHECYGSPLKPPTEAVWRIGNVIWTGVPLKFLLDIARPSSTAAFVWSEGLDYGTFHDITADRYQKDLPMTKALNEEVLVAYEMNGKPMGKERGGPVRLAVPGWFGTNMTKWLCRLSLQDRRAEGPYTTIFYNEIDPTDPEGKNKRPVWKVEVNSIITKPEPGAIFRGADVQVEGWAWCCEEVVQVLDWI